MGVIVMTSNDQTCRANRPGYSAHICEHVITRLIPKVWHSIFSAENDVIQKVGICVAHANSFRANLRRARRLYQSDAPLGLLLPATVNPGLYGRGYILMRLRR